MSTLFSASFRAQSLSESFENVKNKNKSFHHWSKLLRETVECFGDDLDDNGSGKYWNRTYWHGTSYLHFTEFMAYFNGPTSTSQQMEVAMLFVGQSGENGIILELIKQSNIICAPNVFQRILFELLWIRG